MKKNINTLHFITHPHKDINYYEMTEKYIAGGGKLIQLRIKEETTAVVKSIINEIKPVCDRKNCSLIINDHVQLAAELDCDGVHVGKNDMPPAYARKILGENKIIGGTANTIEDIMRLADQGVDYIGLGPFRFTNTKQKLSPILGLDGYYKLLEEMHSKNIKIPVIAIGGITEDDIEMVMETGVQGIAVSGEILKAADITLKTRSLITKIEKDYDTIKNR